MIVFYSKETSNPKNAPYLSILYSGEKPYDTPPASSNQSEANLQESLPDYTWYLVAAAVGVGIFFSLIKKKRSKPRSVN